MIIPGLISVTFRDLAIEDVAALASGCGLRAIDWGADVHVPPGDDKAAERARRASVANGLIVTGYGSYYWAGDDLTEDFRAVLDTALRLGAPTIRVWAGRRPASEADVGHRKAVTRALSTAVEQASEHGITVALEFHGGTLTDTPAGAVELCAATGALSHWQPPLGLDDDDALAGLVAVAPHLVAAHVFSWSASGERHPLESRRPLWARALAHISTVPGDHPALLEFVTDDDPGRLPADAATLLGLIEEVPIPIHQAQLTSSGDPE